MSIDIEQFHGVFFDESDEHLDAMEQLLMALDVDAPDAEELNSIFRAAHSIKGGSGIFGFDALMNLTHVMENLLDKARNHELVVTTRIVNVLLETLDVLKATLYAYRNDTPVPEQDISTRIALLNGVINGKSAQPQALKSPTDTQIDDGFGFFDDDILSPGEANAEDTTDEAFGFFDDEPSDLTTDDEDQGFGFFDDSPASSAPTEEHDDFGFFEDIVAPKPTAPLHTETLSAESDLAEIAKLSGVGQRPKVDSQHNATSAAPKKAAKKQAKKSNLKEASSIRVDTTKIDSMVNLVGELVITQSMLSMIGQEVEGQVGERLQ
ncbi:MAG TPA: chemotaxis protein CheA, partial [Alteromonas australica]|nr:chemotaxis protein CheA [Alteromonas australica]